MHLDSFDEVKKITKELVKIPSIVREPEGETAVARWINNYYMKLPYFQQFPDRVKTFKTKGDFVDRHCTYAYVKGSKGKSNKTIILIGHTDTVGIEDYGIIKEYACDPDNLVEHLLKLNISDEVRADIDSGEFMFGRGALDMKSGVAGHMYLIKYFSEHTDMIDGNIIALSECDEEDNSRGIITALDEFVELKDKENFEYIACINADYSTNYYPGDENRYVYYGSIGKLLPSYFVTGREAHVGQSFGAFDPNLLLAEITREISLNTDLCDIAQGEVTVPPISLKQTDSKIGYTVQTALTAFGYYNFFTHSMSPRDVIIKSKEIAVKAMDNVITRLNNSYKKFCTLSNVEYHDLPWKNNVYTWEEFYAKQCKLYGVDFEKAIFDFANKLNQDEPDLDLRLFSVKVIEEAMKWEKDKSPSVILFFGSVYNARIEMTGRTNQEKELLFAVEKAVKNANEWSQKPIKTRMFYPYISDSSFMAICDSLIDVDAVGNNMPSFGSKYFYDIDKILKINVPVVNIGSFGRDGHMFTERVDMKHTFDYVPNMTYQTIIELL